MEADWRCTIYGLGHDSETIRTEPTEGDRFQAVPQGNSSHDTIVQPLSGTSVTVSGGEELAEMVKGS